MRFVSGYAGAPALSSTTYLYFAVVSGATNLTVYKTSDLLNYTGPVPSFGTPVPGTDAVTPTVLNNGGSLWMITNPLNTFGPGQQQLYLDLWMVTINGLAATHITQINFSAVIGTGASAAVWPAQWFVDDDLSIHIFAAATPDQSWEPGAPTGGNGFVIYECHPTNAGMTTWSVPVAITGSSLPTNTIDPMMIKTGTTYNLFYKNETTKYVELMQSTSLLTGYSVVKSGDWAGWGSGFEAPFCVQTAVNAFSLLIDNQGAGIYLTKTTTGLTGTWTTRTLINSPSTLQHGMVITTPAGYHS